MFMMIMALVHIVARLWLGMVDFLMRFDICKQYQTVCPIALCMICNSTVS